MHKPSFEFTAEMEAIKQEYGLENEDVVLALQSALSKSLGRNIILTTDESNRLQILRINRDGTRTVVTYKSYKKSRKALAHELEIRKKQKTNHRLFALFTPGDIVRGEILNTTKDGCFVAIKGERAFFYYANGYLKERRNGLYETGSTLDFKILHIKENKLMLTRKSVRILKESVYALIQGTVTLKKKSEDTFILYCQAPFLDASQMALIRATLPVDILFKKQTNT